MENDDLKTGNSSAPTKMENQMYLLRVKQTKYVPDETRVQVHKCVRCGELIAVDSGSNNWYTSTYREHGYIHQRCFIKVDNPVDRV